MNIINGKILWKYTKRIGRSNGKGQNRLRRSRHQSRMDRVMHRLHLYAGQLQETKTRTMENFTHQRPGRKNPAEWGPLHTKI